MKLAMENFELYLRFGDEASIKMIKNAGFDAIDYSFYNECSGDEVLGDDYIAHAENVKALLDKEGLECNQAHAPFDLKYGDAFDVSNEKFVKLVRSMEAASIMGAEHIIVHSVSVPSDVDVVEYNVGFYNALVPYCVKFGIKVAIENLFDYDAKCDCYRGKIHTAKMLCDILDRLNSECFVICIDVGHAAIVGVEPDELIRGLDCKVLKALHIHDNDYKSDAHLFPYHGKIVWDKVCDALKEIGYDGDFTLEVMLQLARYEDGFMQEAVCYAGKIGRRLIDKIECE